MTLQNVEVKHFSGQELESFRNIFNQIDNNHDTRLTESELKEFMQRCGIDTRFIKAIIKVFDHNKDNTLSFEEYLQYLDACNETEKDPRFLFRLIFEAVDSDNNGQLSVDELLIFVSLCGQPMTKNEVLQELKKLDIDSNGKINFDELCKAFNI